MPKQKITKEMVVEAAFELARSGGMEQVLVKNIAGKLGCSVQPIYSYCNNMESLRQDVMEKAYRFIRDYIAAHIDRDDFFRSTGHAYVHLAKEEPAVFQMFVTHKRRNVSSLDDLYRMEASPRMAAYIAAELGVSVDKAKELHMNMLIYTVGIATILTTTDAGIPETEVQDRLEAAYQTFLTRTLNEEGDQHNE